MISQSLRMLADAVSTRPPGSVEVVVVVAEAADDTLELATRCAPWFGRYTVVDAGPRAGKGRDVRLGMLTARGRFRLFMDADLATPLHHLDALDPLMAADAAVVVGVRNLWRTHRRWRRRIVATTGNFVVRALLLPGFRDTQCGFKMFRADVCEAVFGSASVDGWGFDLEVLHSALRLGYRIDTLPIPDWHDPRPARQGLAGDEVGAAAREVLGTLLRLRLARRRDGRTTLLPPQPAPTSVETAVSSTMMRL